MLVEVESGDIKDETCASFGEVGGASQGILFWHPRAVTRPGLRNFLKLCIEATQPEDMPQWQRVYEQNTQGFRIALERYGVRFGRHLSKTDRMKVRRLLVDRKTGRVKVKPQPWGAYLWSQGETE